MDGIEKIYYALGELAYLVALADGDVQNSETDKIHAIVVNELKKHNPSFEYSEVIFSVLNGEKQNLDFVYDSAIYELKSASNYLTDDLKQQIISVLTKVAEAYHHVTLGEHEMIEKVHRELNKM